MLNKKNLIIIILILIILAGALYFLAYPKIYNSIYTKGVFAGQSYIIDMITKTGNIPFYSNSSGNLSIQTMNIKEICGK